MVDGVDVAAVLAPLPAGDAGAGEDLRGDSSVTSLYLKLRDARFEARTEERNQDAAGEGEASVPQAWRDVKKFGLQCLSDKSKDFEVAAWLAEALLRLEGLPGLIAATEIISGMLDQYWEPGFPQPDEDGLEGRASPIGGLAGDGADGTLMQPLRRLPLFRRTDGTPVGLHLWQVAEDTAGIPNDSDENKKRRANRMKAGVPEMTALVAEAKTDAANLRRVAKLARTATQGWVAMDAKLNERFGSDAPTTRRVREALERILEVGEKLIGPIPDDAAPAAAEAVAEEAAVAEGGAAAVEGGAVVAGPGGRRALRTREDAIVQLVELAEFFRRTEPHSPLAYTLDDAVRRARMALPDLLAEVLPDAASRTAMLTMLGIRSTEAPAG